MNFRINVDKIITVIVILIILIYLYISSIGVIDFSIFKIDYIREREKIVFLDYIDKKSDYYYKIEGSIYCITKEELRNSGLISYEILDNMSGTIIEAKYNDGFFTLNYNQNCVEK